MRERGELRCGAQPTERAELPLWRWEEEEFASGGVQCGVPIGHLSGEGGCPSKPGAQSTSSGWRLKTWSYQDLEYSKSSLGVILEKRPISGALGPPIPRGEVWWTQESPVS